MNIHMNARPTPFSRERGYVVGRPEGRRKRSLPRLTTSAASASALMHGVCIGWSFALHALANVLAKIASTETDFNPLFPRLRGLMPIQRPLARPAR
jgi:hypothetical protein